MGEQTFLADYDRESDVLYLSVTEPDRLARSVEDEEGLIWRCSREGDCQGVTIRDFRFYWLSHRPAELARLVRAHLPLPQNVAQQIREYA